MPSTVRGLTASHPNFTSLLTSLALATAICAPALAATVDKLTLGQKQSLSLYGSAYDGYTIDQDQELVGDANFKVTNVSGFPGITKHFVFVKNQANLDYKLKGGSAYPLVNNSRRFLWLGSPDKTISSTRKKAAGREFFLLQAKTQSEFLFNETLNLSGDHALIALQSGHGNALYLGTNLGKPASTDSAEVVAAHYNKETGAVVAGTEFTRVYTTKLNLSNSARLVQLPLNAGYFVTAGTTNIHDQKSAVARFYAPASAKAAGDLAGVTKVENRGTINIDNLGSWVDYSNAVANGAGVNPQFALLNRPEASINALQTYALARPSANAQVHAQVTFVNEGSIQFTNPSYTKATYALLVSDVPYSRDGADATKPLKATQGTSYFYNAVGGQILAKPTYPVVVSGYHQQEANQQSAFVNEGKLQGTYVLRQSAGFGSQVADKPAVFEQGWFYLGQDSHLYLRGYASFNNSIVYGKTKNLARADKVDPVDGNVFDGYNQLYLDNAQVTGLQAANFEGVKVFGSNRVENSTIWLNLKTPAAAHLAGQVVQENHASVVASADEYAAPKASTELSPTDNPYTRLAPHVSGLLSPQTVQTTSLDQVNSIDSRVSDFSALEKLQANQANQVVPAPAASTQATYSTSPAQTPTPTDTAASLTLANSELVIVQEDPAHPLPALVSAEGQVVNLTLEGQNSLKFNDAQGNPLRVQGQYLSQLLGVNSVTAAPGTLKGDIFRGWKHVDQNGKSDYIYLDSGLTPADVFDSPALAQVNYLKDAYPQLHSYILSNYDLNLLRRNVLRTTIYEPGYIANAFSYDLLTAGLLNEPYRNRGYATNYLQLGASYSQSNKVLGALTNYDQAGVGVAVANVDKVASFNGQDEFKAGATAVNQSGPLSFLTHQQQRLAVTARGHQQGRYGEATGYEADWFVEAAAANHSFGFETGSHAKAREYSLKAAVSTQVSPRLAYQLGVNTKRAFIDLTRDALFVQDGKVLHQALDSRFRYSAALLGLGLEWKAFESTHWAFHLTPRLAAGMHIVESRFERFDRPASDKAELIQYDRSQQGLLVQPGLKLALTYNEYVLGRPLTLQASLDTAYNGFGTATEPNRQLVSKQGGQRLYNDANLRLVTHESLLPLVTTQAQLEARYQLSDRLALGAYVKGNLLGRNTTNLVPSAVEKAYAAEVEAAKAQNRPVNPDIAKPSQENGLNVGNTTGVRDLTWGLKLTLNDLKIYEPFFVSKNQENTNLENYKGNVSYRLQHVQNGASPYVSQVNGQVISFKRNPYQGEQVHTLRGSLAKVQDAPDFKWGFEVKYNRLHPENFITDKAVDNYLVNLSLHDTNYEIDYGYSNFLRNAQTSSGVSGYGNYRDKEHSFTALGLLGGFGLGFNVTHNRSDDVNDFLKDLSNPESRDLTYYDALAPLFKVGDTDYAQLALNSDKINLDNISKATAYQVRLAYRGNLPSFIGELSLTYDAAIPVFTGEAKPNVYFNNVVNLVPKRPVLLLGVGNFSIFWTPNYGMQYQLTHQGKNLWVVQARNSFVARQTFFDNAFQLRAEYTNLLQWRYDHGLVQNTHVARAIASHQLFKANTTLSLIYQYSWGEQATKARYTPELTTVQHALTASFSRPLFTQLTLTGGATVRFNRYNAGNYLPSFVGDMTLTYNFFSK